MNLNNALMQMPSVQHFIQELTFDLAHGRSTLVLFPENVDYAPVWQAVYERLWQQDFAVVTTWLSDLPKGETLPVALGNILGVRWPSTGALRTVETLAICDDLPEIIYLGGFEQLAAPDRREWLALIRRWTAAAQRLGSKGQRPSALCLMTCANALSDPPPSSDVWLTLHWWWAIPSALELRLLCRCGDGSVDRELDLPARWREHVIPALIGNDTELAMFLWEDLVQDTDHVLECLHAWAEEKGWTPRALRKLGLESNANNSLQQHTGHAPEPPSRLRDLWAHGLLNWTPEYELVLSPAALAVLEDRKTIEHRLWHGQVTILLPMIDNIRLSLCEQWTARYGADWPWRWQLPRSQEEAKVVQSNPFASEWGHIEDLLRNVVELRKERVSLPLVSHARYVRNRLAHYQPVTFRDFEILWYGSRKH
jgi:hypothetical protein